MRFTFVAATLAACHLMWGTAALGYNMYVADPKAGMIYGYEDAGRDPMPAPVLISGQVSLEAWDLVFLSGTESAFISGQNVVAFNSASGRLDLVHAAAPEEWIAAIGYGLNENNFVFAVVDRNTNEITIHDATRAGFGESWTTETYIHGNVYPPGAELALWTHRVDQDRRNEIRPEYRFRHHQFPRLYSNAARSERNHHGGRDY